MKPHIARFGIVFAALFWAAIIALLAHSCHAEAVRVLGTGSMCHLFPKGSETVLELKCVPFAKVRVGMIVVYHHSRAGEVAHRVIEVKPGRIWTKGDSNRMPDNEYVTLKSYMGVIYK